MKLLTIRYKKVLVEIICLLFILLFVYAAVSKLLDYENFRVQLGQSPLLSVYAGWVAWVVPLLEIVIALMLLYRGTRFIGLIGAFTLMITFTAYIYIILNYSSFVPCSCGGILEKLGWTEHLIFNLVFVALAAIAILVSIDKERWQQRKTRIMASTSLLLITVMGIGLVSLLFISSEKRMHHENPFIRRYPHHPATKTHMLDLGYNSYYIAGKDKDKIYLGNVTAPLHLLEIDTTLQDTTHIRLDMKEKRNLPFRSVKVRMEPPYFYVMDGTIPIIFRGKIGEWKPKIYTRGKAYFSLAEPIDTNAFAIRARSSMLNQNTIGKIEVMDSTYVDLNLDLLEKQIDGVFDVDGSLVYNNELQKIIYTYYYRNQFTIADKNLNLEYRGNTIDTIKTAQLQIAYLQTTDSRKMKTPPLMVNRKTATSGKYLFVQSELLGQFENKKMLEQAVIIDVYDLIKNTYELSFYLYHQNKKKMREFKVYNNLLVAMIDDKIVTYLLRDKYFQKPEK